MGAYTNVGCCCGPSEPHGREGSSRVGTGRRPWGDRWHRRYHVQTGDAGNAVLDTQFCAVILDRIPNIYRRFRPFLC